MLLKPHLEVFCPTISRYQQAGYAKSTCYKGTYYNAFCDIGSYGKRHRRFYSPTYGLPVLYLAAVIYCTVSVVYNTVLYWVIRTLLAVRVWAVELHRAINGTVTCYRYIHLQFQGLDDALVHTALPVPPVSWGGPVLGHLLKRVLNIVFHY